MGWDGKKKGGGRKKRREEEGREGKRESNKIKANPRVGHN